MRSDVVLLDLRQPDLRGLDAISLVAASSPATNFVTLYSHCDAYTVHRAEGAGVHGCVDKSTSRVEAVKQALGAVEGGATWFSPACLPIKPALRRDSDGFDYVLTQRECEVQARAGIPLSAEAIGANLGISRVAVE